MKATWLNTGFGTNFVAMGLVAALLSIGLITIQDIVFLVSGTWLKFTLYRQVMYVLLAAIAALFAGVSVFTFRPALPKLIALAVSVAFGSYAIQLFVPMPRHLQTAVCTGRILAFCSLILLFWGYRHRSGQNIHRETHVAE